MHSCAFTHIAFPHIRTYTDTHVCMCIHTYRHTEAHTHTGTRAHTHTHTHTHTHIHTHTHTHIHPPMRTRTRTVMPLSISDTPVQQLTGWKKKQKRYREKLNSFCAHLFAMVFRLTESWVVEVVRTVDCSSCARGFKARSK